MGGTKVILVLRRATSRTAVRADTTVASSYATAQPKVTFRMPRLWRI